MSEQPPTSANGSGQAGRGASDADPDSTGRDEWRADSDGQPAQPAAPTRGPTVDAAQEAAFSRPTGVTGSFAPEQEHRVPHGQWQSTPPPAEALAEAFGRPMHSTETLQRAPGDHRGDPELPAETTSWEARGQQPWRNPRAAARLGPPAAQPEEPTGATQRPGSGPLLSVRDVLFGHRVRFRALTALGAVALFIGFGGGFLGRITAEESDPLTDPDVTLASVRPGPDRPAGSSSAVAQRINPSVVSVEVQLGAQGGTGSGVLVHGDGYVITNNHVVSMASEEPNAQVTTVFHDGTRVPARIVGRDPKTDLAVLKADVANPTVAQLGNSDDVSLGDDVLAIGSPLGLSNTVTTGIVSSTHRPVRLAGEGSDTNAVIDALQTDAAINPGNSGGALVNRNGAVVGITSAIRTVEDTGQQGGSIGLGFAIPIEDARRIAQQIIRTGRAEHADLGVNAKSVTSGLQDGAQVQNVRDGGPAAAAGITEGDVLTRVGQRRVNDADELAVAVDRHRPGEHVPVTAVRAGRRLVFDVTL